MSPLPPPSPREKMISGHAKVAGVMGWPINHSRSPGLHNYWLKEHGIDGVYIPMAVDPAQLESALRAMAVLNFRGCNLTIPHKEKALSIVDKADDLTRRVGAINTIVVESDGSLSGKNTDVFGFMENLLSSGFKVPQRNKKATVLGAGGAARAVIVALQEMGFSDIALVNRSFQRAEQCADSFRKKGNVGAFDWKETPKALEDAALLVNTTSLGMEGQPPLDVDLNRLPPEAWVTDIVYAPLETALLKTAKEKGHQTVDGLGMLLHQARPAFEAWFGVSPQVSQDLRKHVLDDGS